MVFGTRYDYGFKHPNPSTFHSISRQYFSLPFGIIYYITQNPSSSVGFLKLQKTCKYFFVKSKIVVIREHVFHKESIHGRAHSNQTFYLNNFENIKFWLTTYLEHHGKPLNLKNIYRFTLHILHIEKQVLTLNEMNFLLNGGKITKLWLLKVNIRDENSAVVSCDKLLSKVPNITSFRYSSENEIFTNKTFQKMIEISAAFNSKPKYFEIAIYNLSSDADIKLLCEFIFKNTTKLSVIYFYMKMDNSEIYKEILKKAVKEVLQNWITETTKPKVYVC